MVSVTDYLNTISKLLGKARNIKGSPVSRPGDYMKIKYEDLQSAISNLNKASTSYTNEKATWDQEKINLQVQIQQLQG